MGKRASIAEGTHAAWVLRTRSTLLLVVFALLCPLDLAAQERSCVDCHKAGVDQAPPIVLVPPGTPHADLDCTDCHSGRESYPHSKAGASVACADCHSDEDKALRGSSHLKVMEADLAKRADGKPPTAARLCLSCHGGRPHEIQARGAEGASTARAHVASTCLECHGKPGGTMPHITPALYLEGVHQKAVSQGKKAAVCSDCHGTHSIEPGSLPASPVHPSHLSETCGKCHPETRKEYEASIHWQAVAKGVRDAPTCAGCHGEHGIRSHKDAAATTSKENVTKTCSSCHASERMMSRLGIPTDRLATFSDSFHGLSGRLGDMRVANCSSCHENHKVLPSSDVLSSVHPQNLGRTCGKCHPGAEQRFVQEKIHVNGVRPSHWLVALVRRLYLWLIVLTIGGMLFHNGLDLVSKARGGPVAHRHETLVPFFTVGERLQHACLAVSFIVMAASGFVLAFPESFFAWPFHQFDIGPETRRWVHRIAAIVFMALGVFHALYLAFTARGREQARALWPRLRDARDVLAVVRGFFRRPSVPIELAHYSYAEKAEYFALVWGSVVMAGTGLALWSVDLLLARYPVWVVDLMTTIHFWEAVLACLAILVWHGYWVVFDPDVYPLCMKWWTGKGHGGTSLRAGPPLQARPETGA